MLNIFNNSIPHKIKKFDYKTPEWINKSIKLALKKRSKLTKRYHSNATANETPIIPPVFVNRELVSDFKQKANLFSNYFASQCTPIKNGSKLPNFSYKTEKILTSFDIKDDDILPIIKNLNVDKAHGWDQLSIRMIKTCGDSIIFPLKLIFKSIITEGVFPDGWKKSNVVSTRKKESKNLIKNYRPISLLPIFSKVFERLNFIFQNKLFTPCQSGFIPGDSCVSQFLSITHEIYESVDCHPPTDMRGTFLDISKAFDKVWHERLIFKLKTRGVEGNLLKLLENYLTDRQQRVVLNGRTSSWQNSYAGVPQGVSQGVPQGSVLGPLLFLIYINDLADGLTSMCKIFADDTSLFSKVIDRNNSNSQLNSNLAKISKWDFQWKMTFNPDPNKQAIEVHFFNKRDKENYPPLQFNSTDV